MDLRVKGTAMSTVLDIAGLVSLVIMGFLIALWVGFGLIGVGCLWMSYSMTRRTRIKSELEQARRARAIA